MNCPLGKIWRSGENRTHGWPCTPTPRLALDLSRPAMLSMEARPLFSGEHVDGMWGHLTRVPYGYDAPPREHLALESADVYHLLIVMRRRQVARFSGPNSWPRPAFCRKLSLHVMIMPCPISCTTLIKWVSFSQKHPFWSLFSLLVEIISGCWLFWFCFVCLFVCRLTKEN